MPHSIAVVLKLDPIRGAKKTRGSVFFSTQPTFSKLHSGSCLENEHASWQFYKDIKSVVFTAALHREHAIFIYNLIFLLLYLHTVDSH